MKEPASKEQRDETRKALIEAFTEAVDKMLAMPFFTYTMACCAVTGETEVDGKLYETNKTGWPYTFVLNGSTVPPLVLQTTEEMDVIGVCGLPLDSRQVG